MPESNKEIRDQTVGYLEQRVFNLENSDKNKWEDFFGQKPWVVLSVVVVTLLTGFWYYHTWQIERLDSNHNNALSRISAEQQTKLTWLKEQHALNLENKTSLCRLELTALEEKNRACVVE